MDIDRIALYGFSDSGKRVLSTGWPENGFLHRTELLEVMKAAMTIIITNEYKCGMHMLEFQNHGHDKACVQVVMRGSITDIRIKIRHKLALRMEGEMYGGTFHASLIQNMMSLSLADIEYCLYILYFLPFDNAIHRIIGFNHKNHQQPFELMMRY
jgi:hypothetical protein